MACSQTQLLGKNQPIGIAGPARRRWAGDPDRAKNPPVVIILGFHPRDSGSSPDSGIFFCFLRPRACVRAPARGPWGSRVCARACVGLWGVVCLWGFGAGWGAPWRAGAFFFAQKRSDRPLYAGARERAVAAWPLRHLAFTPGARCGHGDGRLADGRRRSQILEKDYHTPPRPNASSRSSRNVPELCTYEPPSTTWMPPLALSSATFVASS